MADDLNRKLSRMGRRRFLGAVAGLGVSSAALQHLTKDVVASTDLDGKVPRLSKLRHTNHEAVLRREEKPKREPIFYTIPRDEWAVTETAHAAAARVNELLEAEGVNDGVTAGVTTITRNHHAEKAVIVKRTVGRTIDGESVEPAASVEELKGLLPNSIAGTVGEGEYRTTIEDIPITIETEEMSPSSQKQETTSTPGNYYNHRYRPVPGGSVLQWGGAESWQYGTGGTPVHDGNHDEYNLVTAGHVLNAEDMFQPEDESKYHIGTRDDDRRDDPGNGEPGFDAGVINLDVDTFHQFAGNGGDDTYWDDVHIFGRVGRDELVDNENSNYGLRKQGGNTGREYGTLEDVYDYSYAFDTSADNGGGDSGGPHLKRVYNDDYGIHEAYIAGIHYAGTGSTARATMMSEIESRYSVEV